MRILADENVPRSVVLVLRRSHDIVWILDAAPRSSDSVVLAMAQSQNRVLLTFDKDFGELAFKTRQRASAGIILVRAATRGPDEIASLVSMALSSRQDWEGQFSVSESDSIRMTPLPEGG